MNGNDELPNNRHLKHHSNQLNVKLNKEVNIKTKQDKKNNSYH